MLTEHKWWQLLFVSQQESLMVLHHHLMSRATSTKKWFLKGDVLREFPFDVFKLNWELDCFLKILENVACLTNQIKFKFVCQVMTPPPLPPTYFFSFALLDKSKTLRYVKPRRHKQTCQDGGWCLEIKLILKCIKFKKKFPGWQHLVFCSGLEETLMFEKLWSLSQARVIQ